MSCSLPAQPLFRSALVGADAIDLTAVGGIDALLAFHRATFGEARMEGDDDSGSDDDSGDDDDSDDDDDPGDDDDEKDVDWKARAKQLEADAARWKTTSRKHEARAKASRRELEEAKKNGLKPEERALEEARVEARAEARREAGGRIVDSHLKSLGKAGRLSVDQVDGLLDGVNHGKFVDDDGEVDLDALSEWVDRVAPKAKGGGKGDDDANGGRRRGPSTRGQGGRTGSGGTSRSGSSSSSGGRGKGGGVASGRDLYAERHGPKKAS